jgi:hypothetical protein
MLFKNEEADKFLKEHQGGAELLENYLTSPRIDNNSTQVEVSSLKYPYKEFSWIFSQIIGLESMTSVPKYIVYILHFVVHEDTMIDWARIISNEISFQLGGLRKTKNFT